MTLAKWRASLAAIIARSPDRSREAARMMLATACAAAGLPGEIGERAGSFRDAVVAIETMRAAAERRTGRLTLAVASALYMLSRLVTRGRYVTRTTRGLEADGAPGAAPATFELGRLLAAANDNGRIACATPARR